MIEVLLNDVTLEGNRRVKVVSDLSPIPFPVKEGACVRNWSDELLGLHYLEAVWACREAIRVRCEGWICARPVVLWKLEKGERVSLALEMIMVVFGGQFKSFPDYAFMKILPKGIENGFEVNDVMLLEAEWVPPGCIVVCKGDDYGFETLEVQE